MLPPAIRDPPLKPRVLFVCSRNAGRSQLAEGLLSFLRPGCYEACSAGVNPSRSVSPHTLAVLSERGIDARHQYPKPLSAVSDRAVDILVILADLQEGSDLLPPARLTLRWQVRDPLRYAGSDDAVLQGFRTVRDELADLISRFIPPPVPEPEN
ncbi:MAG: arsenate reductase ArsC [Methanomicrobiales archaeon]|nr:arsenate reductase ArsC [Methanomicrobiales archaeon]